MVCGKRHRVRPIEINDGVVARKYGAKPYIAAPGQNPSSVPSPGQ